jgi:hypothetical protein
MHHLSPTTRLLKGLPLPGISSSLVVAAAALLWLTATRLHAESPAELAQEVPLAAPPQDEKKLPTYKLGEFTVKNFRPVEQEQLVIRLAVYAEVAQDDKTRFEALWPSHQQRVRSQIITATRILSPQEFDDPQLQALRRRIYLRLRRTLPDLPIEQIYVSDFSYLVE